MVKISLIFWKLMWQMRRQLHPERKTKMDKRKVEAAENVIKTLVADISNGLYRAGNTETKIAVRLLVRSGTITAVDYSAGEVIIDENIPFT